MIPTLNFTTNYPIKSKTMELGEKLSLMRKLKGLTQEEMAEQLSMSVTGYAKIERGETKLQNPRLEKIAQVLGVKIKDLFDLEGKNIFNFNGSFHDQSVQYQYYLNSAIELTQKLEKMEVIIKAKDIEIEYLKQQVADLREMIEALRK